MVNFQSYPNGANKPRFSFDVPVTPPASDPDEGETVCIALALIWIPYVLAALDQLCLLFTWDGTDAEKTLAVQRATNLKEIVGTAQGNCKAIQTPYWDAASDVGDDEDLDSQTWYGTVVDAEAAPGDLTFIENAAVWLFTGLLAVGVDPAVAIAFHTVAPGFVVAMRTGDVAEIFRVVLDGHDVARVDTTGHAANDIINVPVIGDTTLDAHDLLVIKVS